ncbi:GPW/gp25 family protein [Palleronia caenipelagi]|uniref:Phage baseplate protein n=1 Tax=Palleronia caenipelagi TaxID=2489174 RepID=A0A547PWD4_9RHOB|nr:GPW/gp25 family protein [Palleronia caenipelagi]TRD18394.1 phage baseplate protein [Palleronia caenipelagi]
MSGMNRHTGLGLGGDAHLAQSILDILTTPKGTLVMLRDYGSELPDIIDQPLNGETMVDAYMATAEALALWEPRIDLARIELVDARPGRAVFELTDAGGRVLPLPVDLDPQEASAP